MKIHSFLILLVVCRLVTAVILNDKQWIDVGRCRAKCLTEVSHLRFFQLEIRSSDISIKCFYKMFIYSYATSC